MIFVILGMHKSGTTLVSQILHNSGINMGEFDENISYDKGNKYERESTLQLDMEILGATDDQVMKLRSDQRIPLDGELRRRMRGIIAECESRHVDWGFKDPRSILLYDLWAEELPDHKIVGIYRDPAEVWPRFKWGKRKMLRNFARAFEYLTVWQDHNLSLIRFLEESTMEHILICYRDLMLGEKAFDVLQAFTGRDLLDKRRPGLYRSRARMDFFLWVADVRMKVTRGVSIKSTTARLNAMKTPLGS